MEGSFSDFSLHLNATLRIRQSRKHWKIISHQTQQVHHISEFLNLLARTTSFSRHREDVLIFSPRSKLEDSSLARFQSDTTLSLGWMSKGVFEGSSHSYEYLYGITTPLICALERVCSLAESLSFYREQQYCIRQNIPNELLEACEALGDDLLAWDLEAENAEILVDKEIISHVTTVEIFTHHAHAWHRAVLIYFYRRIQQYSTYDLMVDVAAVASHMHAIEDIKERSGSGMPVRMAPITWPAFIASCEATIIDREIWVAWWTRVCQTYKIANMSRQYDLVQHIWKARDASNDERDWIEILVGLHAEVLVI
jgi:arginine metabolism regulation protein II